MKCETAALQNEQEITELTQVFARNSVKSYLEIGSKFGGSLWRVGNSLPRGSRIVSVDLPHGDKSFKQSQPPLEECVDALRKRGYDVHLILGDSTNPKIVDRVHALGPFDAVFIDANHTLPYVKRDWENYSKIARIVAMHDIGFFRAGGMPAGKKPIEVPIFWKEIKQGRRCVEIRYDKQDNGIGVIWP